MALIRVFRMPTVYPRHYLNQEGAPVVMVQVDWFRDDAGSNLIEQPTPGTPEWVAALTKFIGYKKYYDKTMPFLIVHPEHTFTLNYTAP
jgi:hypothetical protein